MPTDQWGTRRKNCPHCSSIKLKRIGRQHILCYDCNTICSKMSNEKAVRNYAIVRMYLDDAMTIKQIAGFTHKHESTIWRILRNYKVPMRRCGRARAPMREYVDATRKYQANSRQVTRSMELLKTD